MLKVGITGGIGSGKTLVAKVFETLGVAIFYADEEAKKTYANDDVKKQIIELFGKDIYINQTTINKELLAKKIFKDNILLNQVNKIIHPAVQNRFDKWLYNNKQHPYIILEAAILFESGFNKFVNKTISVYAPKEIRIERSLMRDHTSREQVLNRINKQISDEERNNMADFIITNDNITPVLPQVLKIHNTLTSLK